MIRLKLKSGDAVIRNPPKVLVAVGLLAFAAFGVVGAAMTTTVAVGMVAGRRSQSFVAVSAVITAMKETGHPPKLTAIEYEYEYGGRRYTSDRVWAGGWQYEQVAERRKQIQASKGSVTAYVDPSDPARACLFQEMNPELRVLAGFGVAFLSPLLLMLLFVACRARQFFAGNPLPLTLRRAHTRTRIVPGFELGLPLWGAFPFAGYIALGVTWTPLVGYRVIPPTDTSVVVFWSVTGTITLIWLAYGAWSIGSGRLEIVIDSIRHQIRLPHRSGGQAHALSSVRQFQVQRNRYRPIPFGYEVDGLVVLAVIDSGGIIRSSVLYQADVSVANRLGENGLDQLRDLLNDALRSAQNSVPKPALVTARA